jgi:hypothetical protein
MTGSSMKDRLVEAVTRDEAWSSFWSRHEAEALIRAVLAELREPTERLVEAGNQADLGRGGEASVTEIWRAMIDAALSEPTP